MSLVFPDGSYTRNFAPPEAGGWAPSPPRQMGQPTQQVFGDPRGGWAAAAPQDRPPPFQMGPAQTPWGQTDDPFGMRWDAVNQMQQQNMQRQMMFNNGGFSPGPTWGQSPFQMYQPGMAQPMQPPAQGTPYGGGQAGPNDTGRPPSTGPGVRMAPNPRQAPPAPRPFSRNQFEQSGAQPRQRESNAPARQMTQQEMRQFFPMPTATGAPRGGRSPFGRPRFQA